MSSTPPDDLPGEVLPSRHRDPVRIAVGGMGAVHRAHDQRPPPFRW